MVAQDCPWYNNVMKLAIKIIGALAALTLLGFIIYSVVVYRRSGIEEHGLALEEKEGYRAVHWHARLQMSACGQKLFLPRNRGTPLLHTHSDNTKVHVEGLIREPADATLGKFMAAVGVPFSAERLFDWQNGQTCPGGTAPAALKMTVNGQPNEQFANLPVNDGDVIELRYE